MEPITVKGEDILWRQCIFPASFKKSAFVYQQLWRLKSSGLNAETSLVLHSLIQTRDALNQNGCKRAASRTERSRLENPKKSRNHIYCGSYQIVAKDICSIPMNAGIVELETVNVFHKVEDEDISHASLIVTFKPNYQEGEIEGAKTAVIDRIWSVSKGPLTHVCSCDLGIEQHPSDSLPQGPGGECLNVELTLPIADANSSNGQMANEKESEIGLRSDELISIAPGEGPLMDFVANTIFPVDLISPAKTFTRSRWWIVMVIGVMLIYALSR